MFIILPLGATTMDSLASGYRTVLIEDGARGVDLIDIEKTREQIISSHGVIVDSSEVKAMVEGRDRRPELGFKLALELQNSEAEQAKLKDRRQI